MIPTYVTEVAVRGVLYFSYIFNIIVGTTTELRYMRYYMLDKNSY